MTLPRLLLFALGSLLCASVAQAQQQAAELKAGNFNNLYIGSPPGSNAVPEGDNQGTLPATENSNFQGMGQVSGSTGPISTSATHADRYPSTPANTLVLVRSTIGGPFASGVPRYSLGEVIIPPLVQADRVTPAEEGYWRVQPVLPGEAFPGVNGAAPLIPLGTVNVTEASTNGTTVKVASVPPELVVGATLLGEPVTKIVGTGPATVTLAGAANATITSSTAAAITPATEFYYSPHAEKVYASQPGSVTITWVTSAATGGNYSTMEEVFSVSSKTALPIRTIYWTEGPFDGPRVQITDGRITTISAAYNFSVPKAVAEEVSIPGYNPSAPNLSSLSFDRFNGSGQLRAYNVEGRIFIEYLGNVRLGANIYESIGTDVVDLVRAPDVFYPTVHLGQEITPHDSDPRLTPSPVLASAQGGATYYGTTPRPDGTSAYYAERETSPPNDPDDGEPSSSDAFNKVVFYWMEEAAFNIKWPKFQDHYWLRWSPDLADYAHYTVEAAGSTPATGVPFAGGAVPQIVYQDDPAAAEAQIDLTTQRLFVTFNPSSSDQRNRTLLKFNSGSKVWYVNLYTQGEGRQLQKTVGGLQGRSWVAVTGSTSLLAPISTLTNTTPTAVFAQNSAINYNTTNFTSGLPGINSTTNFAVVWQGWFDVSKEGTGDYTFGTRSDDGSVVYLDLNGDGDFADVGELIVNNNFAQGATSRVGTVPLNMSKVRIAIGYFQGTGGGSMEARWKKGTFAVANYSSLDRVDPLSGHFSHAPASSDIVWVDSTVGLEVGMVVTGGEITGIATIVKIIDGTHFQLSQSVSGSAQNYTFTVQSDAGAPINTTATVGTRLSPPAGHENGGYISGGTGYYPAGYLNPFVVGVTAANLGAIIPVNALPTDRVLKVRWFKKFDKNKPGGAGFQDLYVPGKWGTYTVSYPAGTNPQIVIAQGVGTNDLSARQAAGSVYVQNDPALPGYNPNEEHAFPLVPRVYALRDDLNVTSGTGYTSQPFVLIAYTDTDARPSIHAYKVVRTVDTGTIGVKDQPGDILFDYTATAGTLLVKPYPLPLLPLPLVGSGVDRASKDLESIPTPDPLTNTSVASNPAYKGFTFEDRKGFTWIHRGPHAGGSPTLRMKLYYLSRQGFFIPGMSAQPPEGTVLPFLRAAARSGQKLDIKQIDSNPDGSTGQLDEPLTIVYRPTWPANAPELRVGETLTLPKFGLPQVRGQTSAHILYQQSIAKAASITLLAKNSVTLHDPTREKTVALDDAAVGLTALPSAINVTSDQGKTYFQGLPPHLQQRVYLDPLRGAKGTLVFTGTFHDEPAGEDYLDLNLLTAADELLLKGLVPDNTADKSKWDAAINALKTTVETFKPDPAQFGSYIVDAPRTVDVGRNALAIISDPNTAVDSYAVTATGQGSGFVTMVFGNGNAFTPEGDPVQIKVFKVAEQLYVGDLKVLQSSNPLDEQVTLRHSGDFAGKPEDYEFQWRWAPGAATAPAAYTAVMTKRIGNPASSPVSDKWTIVSDPGALTPTAAQYTAAGAAVQWLTRNVRPVNYVLNAQGQPTSTVVDVEPFTKTPSAKSGTTVTVDSTALIQPGMTVTGASISGTATVTSVTDPTKFVLSQSPTSLAALTIDGKSYTDADIAAGNPSLMAKSSVGVDFTSGVPGNIVFSATLGSFDGCVLYVNGQVAIAHNAPEAFFTNTNASTGLTGTGLGKQFSIAPSYFSKGPNTIEVAIYTTADPNTQSSLNFMLEAAQETDVVASGGVWQTPSDPTGKNTNTAIVGGSPLLPFGGPQFVLNDRWFTMRYRPKLSSANILTAGKATQNDVAWSRWMPPQFVEGWIKRVLAAINPFEQRIKDFSNNAINTDVSLITQAGTRWEGDIALTLDGINDVGLIAIYETVLNRAKSMSIDANTNDPDTNNALILAAGYLNDLYTILGNEAYADAANPTISLDDQTTVTEVNTSRFSFEGQVASSLDEELALLKGRDDFTTAIDVAPAYNRLYWNYTRGINAGEVIYSVNYNIKEKVGSSTANGVIDESDAQRMFPQAHGDAYGHYLTALTGYYRLLSNANFTWTPRAEAVTVLGQPVTVDYMDERKFAAAAGNVARTAQQIVALTYRQSYVDDPAAGWGSYRDSKGTNTQTNVTSAQGLDEWVSRSTQGAFFHWAVANALLPDVDNDHTGIQKIDRTTVPEIPALVTAATTFQTTIDNANAHLNPLGLSPGAIAFDISPSQMMAGQSHFEQVYERSLRSLVNASGAFNQAATMTRSLRNQQNQIDDYTAAISDQESAYVNELIDIFGRPYSAEIGTGKTYAQGYDGPDLLHWFIVDRPNDLVDPSQSIKITITSPKEYKYFTGNRIDNIVAALTPSETVNQTVTVNPSQFVQYNDVWKSGGLGSRAETGALQDALQDAQQTYLALSDLSGTYTNTASSLERAIEVFKSTVENHESQLAAMGASQSRIEVLQGVVLALTTLADGFEAKADLVEAAAEAAAEGTPKVTGVIAGTASGVIADVMAGLRSAAKFFGVTGLGALKGLAVISNASAGGTEIAILKEEHGLERELAGLGFSNEELQLAYELESLYREHTGHTEELMQLTLAHQRALQNVINVLAKGNRVLADRNVFRQRAAAIIQGYRTKDLAFRTFRNEALEQYRSLFDLSSRYTYLAAKSYDYETGLLGTTAGQTIFSRIIKARSLGDLTGGVPQSTVSTLGDAGLAGTMAQLNADFSVAEGRLGINNPDQNGTVFSLRGELYRLLDDPDITSDDDAWRQTMEQHIVANVMSDADVATYCRNIKKPDGTPVPGIIIPFSTSILHGRNFFGLPLAAGDHAYTPSNFATKIYNVGIALPGYVGMDSYASGNPNGSPTSTAPHALSATPYVYLIPCGSDYMLAPPLGDTNTLRSWDVKDQALPLPYNLGANDFNDTQFFNANGTLSEQPWILRKHQAFRAVADATAFYSSVPAEFTNSRLIGRSVWNGQWKIVIPAYTLLTDEQTGLDNFAASVKDIQLFLRTYSNSGN